LDVETGEGIIVEKCVNRLYLLYTSQNLLGTIFRVTFIVFYRRIWNIVGKYSILCCDRLHFFLGNELKYCNYWKLKYEAMPGHVAREGEPPHRAQSSTAIHHFRCTFICSRKKPNQRIPKVPGGTTILRLPGPVSFLFVLYFWREQYV
jgi:hypothetical protein